MLRDSTKGASQELREEEPIVAAWLRIFEEADQATENTEEPPESDTEA